MSEVIVYRALQLFRLYVVAMQLVPSIVNDVILEVLVCSVLVCLTEVCEVC